MEDSGIDSGDHNGDNTKASQNGDTFHVRLTYFYVCGICNIFFLTLLYYRLFEF